MLKNNENTPELLVRDIPRSVTEDSQNSWPDDGRVIQFDEDSDGRTLFDTPQSEDNSIIVVFPQGRLSQWRTQSLAHIESHEDNRIYLAQVVQDRSPNPMVCRLIPHYCV